MDYKKNLSSLFFLLIHADGNVSENEMTRGRQMLSVEGIDETTFNSWLEELRPRDRNAIYKECILALKKHTLKNQIRCIAWLCVLANADGFMDKKEWMLIYKIYRTELGLRLDDIMLVQKELNAFIHGKAFHSLGVRTF